MIFQANNYVADTALRYYMMYMGSIFNVGSDDFEEKLL